MENILNDSTTWGVEAGKLNDNFSELQNSIKYARWADCFYDAKFGFPDTQNTNKIINSFIEIILIGAGWLKSENYVIGRICRNNATHGYRLYISKVNESGVYQSTKYDSGIFDVTESVGHPTRVTFPEVNGLSIEALIDYSFFDDGSDTWYTSVLNYVIKPTNIYADSGLKTNIKKSIGAIGQMGTGHDLTYVAAKYEQSKPFEIEIESTETVNQISILEPNPQKRYLVQHWADGRVPDANFNAPLLLKYGFNASFGFLIPRYEISKYSNNAILARKISKSGLGLTIHGCLFGYSFLYHNPDWDGIFPTDSQLKSDAGGGLNIFGKDINDAVGITAHGCVNDEGNSVDLSAVLWKNLTTDQCRYIRNSYSAYERPGIKTLLDELSNEFCGTTTGIFEGCSTHKNHEIWERMMDITKGYFGSYFEYFKDIKSWTDHGGYRFIAFVTSGTDYYHDAAMTIPANGYGRFTSSLSGEARGWADILLKYGISIGWNGLLLSDYDYRFGWTGITFNDTTKDVIKQVKNNNIRLWSWSDAESLSSLSEPLVSSTDWLKYIYDNYSIFSNGIKSLVSRIGTGEIPVALEDAWGDYQLDTFNFEWVMAWELFLQFCKRANIEIINFEQAIAISQTPVKTGVNLFPNSNFLTSIKDIINPTVAYDKPDGWSDGIVITDEVDAVNTRVLKLDTGTSVANLYIYSLDLGHLKFNFWAKKTVGNGTVKIYKCLRKHRINPADYILLDTITVDSLEYSEYLSNLKIEKSVKNEDWYSHLQDINEETKTFASCQGYDDDVAAIYITLEGEGLCFAFPSLTK